MRHNANGIEEQASKLVIAVDAMGADHGAAIVVAGLARASKKRPDAHFILFGDKQVLKALVKRRKALKGRVEIRHTKTVIASDEKPSHAMRHGKGSSMYGAIKAVKKKEAEVAISCGNTGALMALSMLILRRLPGVHRPAIAILWPSKAKLGFSVMLDVGADIRADATDLLKFALMGASFVRNGFGLKSPKIGLLNVGTESHKGRPELQEADEMFANSEKIGEFRYKGFVEGTDMPSGKVDVIVTDGFTGNVAIKTAEGTASFIGNALRKSFKATLLSRIASLFAITSLRRLKKEIDPRRKNGGVFLGLNGTVVKSHGSADALGMSAALMLAIQLAEMRFSEKLAARIASTALDAES